MEAKPHIIYEDDDILAVDKPAGISVHPSQKSISNFSAYAEAAADRQFPKSETLVGWLIENYPQVKQVGDDPKLRPGIVHRIDKDTSGVLLIAKNQSSFDYLKGLFQRREIDKRYIVLVVGRVKEKIGIIDLSIARSAKDPIKRVARGKVRGKERDAITEYKVLEHFYYEDKEFTLCEAHPITGRTHQIRSHFSAIGHPVVCDKLYSGKRFICPVGLTRHALHAKSLEFVLRGGARIRIEANLPEDLERVLDDLCRGT